MTSDASRRVHAIFTAALERPRSERDAVVAAECAGDASLEARVRRLLAAAEKQHGFLESPALATPPDAWTQVPDAVGSYLVIGVLGVGGMGTVYEAVQENPNRRVALKVMRQGMAHTDAYLRFRLETEALARLRHQGIAQIYEAGTAQLGQPSPVPFFAMELVPDARTITEHAREKHLSLRERLVMFASVCDAVLHGHQQGIIHRDLKPGNILVGSEGVPKVIDFGIARTITPRPGGAASLTGDTNAHRLLGTLNYMSPEQCNEPSTVDVRSDVYSLGVILYELVAGRLPYDLSQCSIPEAVRVITDGAPPLAGSFLHQARGDLDAIICKAMEKDRGRRYNDAGSLAADLRRHLNLQPIEARPATTLDQLGRFVRRNPPLAGAIGAALLMLILGVVVSGRFAVLATRARDAALQRERDLEVVTRVQESLLRDLDVAAMGDRLRASLLESVGRAAASGPGSGSHAGAEGDAARDVAMLAGRVNFTSLALRFLNESMIQRYAASIDGQFKDQPRLRARLLQQLADTMNTLGLRSDAEPILRRALDIRRATLGPDHEDTLQSLHSLGTLLASLGHNDEAIATLKDAHDRRARTLGPEDQATLRTGTSLGGVYRRMGNLTEAERVWRETLHAQRRTLGDDHADTLRTLNNMGIIYAMQGKPQEAEVCWRELLERRRRLLGEDHPEYLGSLGNLGVLLQDQGKYSEARVLLEQALAADRRRYGDTHAETLVSMAQLASLLLDSGDLQGAESLQRECLQGRTATLGPDHQDTLRAVAVLALILHRKGDSATAREMIDQAIEAQARQLGADHPETVESMKIRDTIRQDAKSQGSPQ